MSNGIEVLGYKDMTFLQEEEIFPAANFFWGHREEVNAPVKASDPSKEDDINGSSELEGNESSKRKLSDKEANKQVCPLLSCSFTFDDGVSFMGCTIHTFIFNFCPLTFFTSSDPTAEN